jgi:hypothetical protein
MATKLSTLLGSSFTGTAGPAGSIQVGTVTSNPGATTVTNVGTEKSAILNFNIVPGDFDWPSVGIAVSTGSGWDTSITLGSGVSTFLTTASSANLASAVTDETGSGSLVFATSPTLVTPILGTPTSGNLTNCTADGTDAVGFKNIPSSGADKTSSYSLVSGDVGKFVGVGTGGSITVPSGVFSAGSIISLYNNTTGNITITCSAVTTYIGGTNTEKTSVTLATRGICNIFFYSASICIITGNVT